MTAPPPEKAGASATAGAGATGKGTGAGWLVTVTVEGAQLVVIRRTTRGAGRRLTALTLVCLTTAGRALLATWTAPPPRIAPPAAQAQSFAMAIRTDIFVYSLGWGHEFPWSEGSRRRSPSKRQNNVLTAIALTLIGASKIAGPAPMRDSAWLMYPGGTTARARVNASSRNDTPDPDT